MKLKSFGCSFVWGSELSDITLSSKKHSQLTWPALLAQHFDFEYECYAFPGCGNFYIASQCLDQLASDEPAVYVINWSFIDRFDFVELSRDRWETLRPGLGNHECAEFYYRNLHSELKDKIQTMQLAKLVALELEAGGHPYIMTCMDELMFDQRWHTTAAMLAQQKFLQPRVQAWPAANWCKWAGSQGHKITAAGHLLDSGHRLVFEDLSHRLQQQQILTCQFF